MKKIALLFSVLLLSACSSVQGVIRDKPSGSPIPSAHVTVKKLSAVSNALGHYKVMGAFIPGDTMMINAPGYNIYTATIKSTNEIIDIELTPKKP